MKKILFVHNTLPEYRIEFFRRLSEKDDVTFLILDKGMASKIYDLQIDNISGLNIVYLEDIGGIGRVETFIGREKWDYVVLAPTDSFYLFYCDWKIKNVVKSLNIPMIYWTEEWQVPKHQQPLTKRLKSWVKAQMIGYMVRRSDKCVVAGSKSKEFALLTLRLSNEKIVVAYDSSTSPICSGDIDIRNKYGLLPDSKVILFLGRLIKRKGCHLLIDAFIKIQQQVPNAILLIAGDGEEVNNLKLQARGMTNVIFVGKIEPSIRAVYFKQSTEFCLPSYSLEGVKEAWGLTVNESLEQGTPVVATTAVGAAHDLLDGNCGMMVEENDVEALADGLLQYLDSVDRQQICETQYAKYSVENMAKEFAEAWN